MKTRNLLLTSLLTVAVVGLFGAVLASSMLPGNANAVQMIAGHVGAHSVHAARSGRWHAHACDADHREKMLELADAWVSISLDLTDSQQAALEPVLDSVSRWYNGAGVCPHPEITDAPTALNLMNSLIDHTQTVMDELLPAFTHFYGTLTPAQQTRLNTWIREHHGA